MKKHIYNKRLFVATMGILLTLSSCNDFLDKQPSVSSNTTIADASQLFALMDNPNDVEELSDAGAFMVDDCGLSTGLIDNYPTIAPMAYYTAFYSEGIAAQASSGLWGDEFEKIFKYNTVISYASSVDNSALAQQALANAYFLRAWSFYTLAQYYCLPYCEENKQSLGLPLRLGTDFEESLSRVTLEETYKQILSDLANAEAVTTNAVDTEKRWRSSKCAVNGLYARIYMIMGDYQKAKEYNDKALAVAPALFDYNKFTAANPAIYQGGTCYYCETTNWSFSEFLYFPEFIFTRFTYSPNQWFMPSKDLIASYDQENDLRYKWFMIPNGNLRFSCPYQEYRYNLYRDGSYAFSGISTAELILNKAELNIRLGNWQQGIKDVEELRAARYVKGADVTLTASGQGEALKQVLAERRREFPFAYRMSDIKRFSVNETTDDDVTITRDFYEMNMSGPTSNVKHFAIKGNDPLLAIPITDVEINASLGQIQQNPY